MHDTPIRLFLFVGGLFFLVLGLGMLSVGKSFGVPLVCGGLLGVVGGIGR